MPKLVYFVIAWRTVDLVNDHYHVWLLKLDAAAVGEACVPAFRFQQIALGARLPRVNLDARATRPSERTSGGGLIQPVDLHGIVGGGATKPIAPFWITNVGVGS